MHTIVTHLNVDDHIRPLYVGNRLAIGLAHSFAYDRPDHHSKKRHRDSKDIAHVDVYSRNADACVFE